jgi:pSer/pThr/pTyr-binding forkhead associated (FHA) protein
MYREKGAKTWNIEETGDNTVMLPNINLNADYEVVVLPKQNLDNDYITITEHLVDDIAPDKDDVFSVGKSKIETVSFRNKADFTIAPNPANNIVTVDLKNIDSTVKTYIRVTDLSGVEHYNKLVNVESTTQQIDVNNLKDGMYFISTLTEDENGKKVVETKKMLVSH